MNAGADTGRGEGLHRLVFERAGVGLCTIELDGRIFPNPAFAAILGYRTEELIDRRWQDLTHPEDVESASAAMVALAEGRRDSERWVKRYLHKTRGFLWGETVITLHRGETGRPAFLIGSLLEVGERRAREDEQLLRQLCQVTTDGTYPDGVLVVDAHGRVLSCNRRFLELCRVAPGTSDLGDGDAVWDLAVRRFANPEAWRGRLEWVRRNPLTPLHEGIALDDGRMLDAISMPMMAREGEQLGRMWAVREVDEGSRVEFELRERLRELERWQDVMLDREERVAELKQEVNELCVRLGETARYATEEQDDEASDVGPFKVTATLATIPDANGPEGEGV